MRSACFMTFWRLSRVIATLALVAWCQAPAWSATATGARVGGDENRTRFVADLSQPVSFTVYVLPDPYRVIIDVADLTFKLPPGIGRKVRGLISEYRYGPFEPGHARFVIDTTGPVLIEKSFLVPPQAAQPARLVVDLVKSSEAAFQSAYEATKAANSEAIVASGVAPEPVAAPAAVEERAPAESRAGGVADRKRVIVLDPGHGGIDPGAISRSGTKEKDVVFAFAKALRASLASSGTYDIRLTRDEDAFLPLAKRVAIARKANADLFIAIHADTVRGPTARGLTLYTVSEKASDAEAAELADKENRADIIGGMDLETENQEVTDILIDLAQRESKNHAVLFSKKAVSQLKPVALMTGKPMRSAGFVVLKAPDVPSVLIELGYLSSTKDEALLTSPAWHAKMAAALRRSVDAYFSSDVAQRSE
jgi:N-acetylmuramoyl-L-alanine amidase